MLEFSREEVLLVSFMLMDYDGDGLVSHSDLFRLLTVMDRNRLVKSTVYTLLKHAK